MQSKAKTVAEYLAALTSDQREAIAAVRTEILANLDAGYEETMQYGMIGYVIPHRLHPAGYHCDPTQPVPFAALAAQKNHFAVYLTSVYSSPEETKWFTTAWRATGKKLDMGKACVRFKRLEDVALDVVGQTIRRMPLPKWLGIYQASPGAQASQRSTAKVTVAAAKPKRTAKAAAPKRAAAGKPVVRKAAAKPAGKPPKGKPAAKRRAH